jgi:hypothetical protein
MVKIRASADVRQLFGQKVTGRSKPTRLRKITDHPSSLFEQGKGSPYLCTLPNHEKDLSVTRDHYLPVL